MGQINMTEHEIGIRRAHLELYESGDAPRMDQRVLSDRRAEINIPFHVTNGAIEFTIPKIVDYEVAALYA